MVDLDHLNLPVPDVEKCGDFYVDHFGFERAFESEGGWFLRWRDAGVHQRRDQGHP